MGASRAASPRVCYEQFVQIFPATTWMSARTSAVVGAGGAIGAVARWAIGSLTTSETGSWPWATLAVNLLGCIAIGVAARRLSPGTEWWAFAVTGVLGGFTTFSAFAVELDEMVDAQRFMLLFGFAIAGTACC